MAHSGRHDPDALLDWRTALGASAGDRNDGSGGSGARGGQPEADTRPDGAPGGQAHARRTPLALQFELREPSRRGAGRWQHAAATTVPAEAGASDVRVAVRPVVLSSAGRWTTAKVGWGALHYQVNRLGLDEEQVRWFSQFSALNRATQGVYLGQDQERLILDDFNSPLLWHLFGEAERLGIDLVGTKRNSVVRIGRYAEIRRDATAEPDAGIRLRTTIGFAERAVSAAAVGTIGDHGLYAVDWLPAPRLELAPTAGRLDAERLRALRHPELVVPAAETAEFLTEFYPELRASVPITSDDGSVIFPEIHPPLLALTVRYDEGGVSLDWRWEYRVGDRVCTQPLGAGGPDTRRDTDAESEILERVGRLLAEYDIGAPAGPVRFTDLDAVDFTESTLPALTANDDLKVEIVGGIPHYRELTERPILTVSTVETDDNDWFDLGVLVHVNGRIIPFGPLFRALSTGRTRLLLVDKTYLSLKQPVFDRLRELIDEAKALSEWETGLRISRHQTRLWSDFEDLADESEPAVSWRAAVGDVLEVMAAETDYMPSAELPTGLTAELRPYQRHGYDWLAFLWSHRLGGILADDMGLGKTVQTLALIARAVEDRSEGSPSRFLVIAPTSVVSNWKSESERFTPGLRVVTIRSTQTKTQGRLAELWQNADVVVTSYTLFRLDFAAYRDAEWAGLILDEAQFVKNHAAQANQYARELRTPFKLAITGTPMENNVMELWALFSIVAPGLFASGRRFTEEYLRPLEHAGSRGDSDAVIERLRRRIRPLMLRRTKDLVAPELPEKQEQVIEVELSDAHRELYDTFLQRERQKLFGLIDDLDRNRFIVFRSLTLLRMLSLDPSLIDPAYSGVPSSKLNVLLEQLGDVLAEGHRALVFSQFTSFLSIAAERLTAAGIEYAMLDGTTSRRDEVIDRFRTGVAPVFLISLKAGGFGLNLTEADYVFLLDPWWNPAAEAQAIDRTHRIGQEKSVMVYRLVATGTIEEKVMQLKEKKARLFDALMNDDATAGAALTATDIRGLLEG